MFPQGTKNIYGSAAPPSWTSEMPTSSSRLQVNLTILWTAAREFLYAYVHAKRNKYR